MKGMEKKSNKLILLILLLPLAVAIIAAGCKKKDNELYKFVVTSVTKSESTMDSESMPSETTMITETAATTETTVEETTEETTEEFSVENEELLTSEVHPFIKTNKVIIKTAIEVSLNFLYIIYPFIAKMAVIQLPFSVLINRNRGLSFEYLFF